MVDQQTDLHKYKIDFLLFTTRDKPPIHIRKWFSTEEVKNGVVTEYVKKLTTEGLWINRKKFLVYVPGHAITQVHYGPIYNLGELDGK